MSDTSQGPGWWQASDGKWYAPELHPDQPGATAEVPIEQAPLSPQPPAGGRGAGRWIAVATVIAVVAAGTFFVLRDRDNSTSARSFCATVSSMSGEAAFENATTDPSRIAEFSKLLDQLVKAAPSEIKGDMKTIADAMHTVLNALQKAGSDPQSQFGAFFAAAFTLDQKKLNEAGDRLNRYTQEHCGFTLDSGSHGFSTGFSFSASLGPPPPGPSFSFSPPPPGPSFSFDFSGFESFSSS